MELPEIESTVSVVAIDSAPKISLKLPKSITSQSELAVSAIATDDVSIAQVTLFLDGEVISVIDREPFELLMPISEELEGRVLAFSAKATDSAGQETFSMVIFCTG